MENNNFAMMCHIVDNRNKDEKFIDKSKCLADTLAMYIDRINRLYRGINSINIATICISKYYSDSLNEHIDILAKDIKQLDYEIHSNVVEDITEFINLYNPDPVCSNTSKAEYGYYIDHFAIDCGPGFAYYRALNMTKYKKAVIEEAKNLKSSKQELGARLYELALKLRDLELYLRTLIKQISKCNK